MKAWNICIQHQHVSQGNTGSGLSKVFINNNLIQGKNILKTSQGEMKLTNHSLWPWKLSVLSRFTAITMPVPGLVAVYEFSSIHPLNTAPKPPSPSTLSGRKFRVAALRSEKLKPFKLGDCKISPSLLGVKGADETLLLGKVGSFPSELTYIEFIPKQR